LNDLDYCDALWSGANSSLRFCPAQNRAARALHGPVCYTGVMREAPQSENSCGACAVCCLALRIDEFSKPAGTMCQHCTGTGCGIYETRYEVCRGFLCGYRMVPALGDAWRPDRSGILILTMEQKNVPEEHRAAGMGMQFVILGGEKAIRRRGFAEYVATLVSRNVAVYMSADSPKTLINKYLVKQAAAKDHAAMVKMLVHIYRKRHAAPDRTQIAAGPFR
jgi:hypothetical protein